VKRAHTTRISVPLVPIGASMCQLGISQPRRKPLTTNIISVKLGTIALKGQPMVQLISAHLVLLEVLKQAHLLVIAEYAPLAIIALRKLSNP